MNHLTTTLRKLKAHNTITESALAEACHVSRASIHAYLTGTRTPTRATITALDTTLHAGGALIHAWQQQQLARRDQQQHQRELARSVADSLRLAREDPGLTRAETLTQAADLPVAALWESPANMLTRCLTVRAGLLDIAAGRSTPGQVADVHHALSTTCGTLAYAALDLGHPDIAMVHLNAADALAGRAGDLEGQVWAAGTRSLIHRFRNEYPAALAAIEDGLRLGEVPGTGVVRLLSGLGQCRANLGDAAGAREARDLAARARERITTPDTDGGLYNFTLAKQSYYTGSSLIHLPDAASARLAIDGAQDAIDTWETAAPDEEFTNDAILCRLYQGLAYLTLGDLAGVADRVQPVIALPDCDRISWVTKRLRNISDRLSKPPWADSVEAQALRDLIR